ncbi:unnamed protein product [Adineta steineri]|uniref:Uncharacterized protein n=1 Tax=Adineta steineri TaxID=433720 RepID=A0A813T6Q5_9BILA|nr:unnamed protein product [Adineta steineri]CAF4124844.1 unnamed protein product [Adineta steineri]
MESNLIQEDVFLFAPPSFENHHDDQRNCSGSGISSNGSFVGDEWTASIETCKEAEKNEMLLSRTNADIIAQVYPSIVKVPWQDEVSIDFSKNGRSHVCLGISPSQFRRLLSSRRNAAHKSTRDAILYAQMAMQYTLNQIDQSKESGISGSLIVLIVDAIQMFNYAVFNNKLLKTGTARKYALEEGDRLIDVFIQARSQLAPELA